MQWLSNKDLESRIVADCVWTIERTMRLTMPKFNRSIVCDDITEAIAKVC